MDPPDQTSARNAGGADAGGCGPVLAALDAAERGFVLGILLLGESERAGAAAMSLAPAPVADRCAAAVAAMVALARPERIREMSLLARDAMNPLPIGLETIHPDTLQDLLTGQSTAILRWLATARVAPPTVEQAAVTELEARGARTTPPAGGDGDDDGDALKIGAAGPEAATDLQRAVFAPIVSLPPPLPTAAANCPSDRLGLRLAALIPSALMDAVREAGTTLLGTSLRGADDLTLERAIAHIGPPWDERLRQAARPPTDPDDAGAGDGTAARARARRMVAAARPAADPQRTLDELGARALGDLLRDEDTDVVRAVAQRLPRALGQLLAEAATAEPASPRSLEVRPTFKSG